MERLLLLRRSGWNGIATVTASLASALTMLGPTDNHSVIYAILLLAAVLGFTWLLSASLTLTTTRRRYQNASPALGKHVRDWLRLVRLAERLRPDWVSRRPMRIAAAVIVATE